MAAIPENVEGQFFYDRLTDEGAPFSQLAKNLVAHYGQVKLKPRKR
jgi:hypothetical protein